MAKVMERVGVYSKKNGMVYRSIKQFEGNLEECKKYVLDKYGKNIEKGEQVEVQGLLSKKYIKITGWS